MALRAVLAAVAIGLVLWQGLGPSGARARGWLRAALLASCLVGVGNYFGFESRQLLEVRDHYDVTFYYLNSKYFDELGYSELYRAMLLADQEGAGAHRLDHIRVARDLGDYQNRPRAELMRGAEGVRERFTAERWRAFIGDVAFLVKRIGPGQLDYLFKDHGYNATPTWTVLGGALANAVDVTGLKWITSLDLVLLAIMFVVLARSFGLEVMLFALLFFTCTHSGRWPVAGQALLRFDWLVALVTGWCALGRGRAVLAGVLFAYAVQARLFPAVYLVPVGLGWLALWVRERRLPAVAWRTGAGFVGALGLFVGVALARYGGESLADAAARLAMHAGPASYSSLRVGLADALVFRGERYWPILGAVGGIPAKALQVGALGVATKVVAVCVCVLIGAHALRRRRAVAAESLLPLGGLLLFALFNPQINYFNARLLWVPWHLAEPSRLRNLYGLGMLFLVEVVANVAHAAGAIDYAVTSLSSVGLLLHAVGVCGGLIFELRAEQNGAETGGSVRRAGVLAVVALCASAAVLGGYWQAGTRPAPGLELALKRLGEVRAEGVAWNAPGNHVLGPDGLRVTLGATGHASALVISHEHDDHYELVFERAGTRVGRLRFGTRNRGRRGRLVHTTVRVPAGAVRAGYDALLLLPSEGDARFSVGHLQLRD
jgi:hypothetical protein